MKRSNRLVLLVGVFLAVVAFVAIALLLTKETPPGTGPDAVITELPTVVAVQDIALGTTVTTEMLTTVTKKIDGERKTTAFQDTSLVVGKIARRHVSIMQGKKKAEYKPECCQPRTDG